MQDMADIAGVFIYFKAYRWIYTSTPKYAFTV
jgi:hypothetical protein